MNAPALLTNIRLDQKVMSGTKSPAYYKDSCIMDIKFFIRLGPSPPDISYNVAPFGLGS
jgi:hypothetical protein